MVPKQFQKHGTKPLSYVLIQHVLELFLDATNTIGIDYGPEIKYLIWIFYSELEDSGADDMINFATPYFVLHRKQAAMMRKQMYCS